MRTKEEIMQSERQVYPKSNKTASTIITRKHDLDEQEREMAILEALLDIRDLIDQYLNPAEKLCTGCGYHNPRRATNCGDCGLEL